MQNKKRADELLRQSYDTYYEKIARFCNIKLKNRNEAEDCVQECFMVYYKRILSGEEIGNTGAFLYKIADNLIKTQWRQDKKANNIVSLDELAETLAVNEVYNYGNIDYDSCAEKIIGILDEKEQCLYKLKYTDQKSIAEIAEELNISFDAAAKRLSRLRQKVKSMVEEEMKGEDLI
ncbi:MAG: sigma-70 family RNA polymerase sigma factor [Ruminococcaceae bacterium]|nr:sigma-70 family RNA polymerase sigma factor [Oscillospiraceae bacterium]